MLNLSSDERRVLRARAHSLHPVVSISQNGLSDAVVREVDVNLNSHELIKIRVYNDDRQAREQFLATLCERLDAAAVQHIGKLLVIWRPRAADLAQLARPRQKRNEPRRSKRSFQGGSGA